MNRLSLQTRDNGQYVLNTIVSRELQELVRELVPVGCRFVAILFEGCWLRLEWEAGK